MAGDWIQIEHDLPSKEEVAYLLGHHADELRQSYGRPADALATIIGRLTLMWIRADRLTEDGVLKPMDPLSASAAFGGTPEVWKSVEAVGWVTFADGEMRVTDFLKRFGKSARRRMLEAARKQLARSKTKAAKTKKRPSGGQHADALRPPCAHLAPPDSESISESKKNTSCSSSPSSPPGDTVADKVRQVFAHYRVYHPKAHPDPQPDSKEWRLVVARLKEGYAVETLKKAIDGCHLTPYNLGQNERGQKYLSLELILRNSSNVSRFMEAAFNPPNPKQQGSIPEDMFPKD